jgi:hypothetical protein
MAETSKPSIEVEVEEREMYDLEWHLKSVVESMLRLGERVLNDTKEYYVTVKRDEEEHKEKIAVSFNIEIQASDDLIERTWEKLVRE